MRGVTIGGLCLLLAACGGGTDEAGPGDAAPVAPVSSAPGPTSTTDTDSPGTIGDEAADLSDLDLEGLTCDNERYLDGDFDGDGRADRAYQHESRPWLVVCTPVGNQVLPVGRPELVIVADVDADGGDEILVGGTTAWGQGVEIVALVDGRLDRVVDPAGEPLSLWRGLPPGRVLASGCGSFTGSGVRQIGLIEGRIGDAGLVTWELTVYRLDGHSAAEVATDSGTFDVGGAPDPLATEAMEDLVGEPCW